MSAPRLRCSDSQHQLGAVDAIGQICLMKSIERPANRLAIGRDDIKSIHTIAMARI